MTIALRASAGAVALALLVPAVAAAQPPRNPFAELFGRAPERTGREFTAVQFRSSAAVQTGQTLHAGFEAADTVIPDGLSGSADATLLGEYRRDRVQLTGHARYGYHEFRQQPAFGAPGIAAGGRADFRATTRLAFNGAGQFIRSPFFSALWLTANQAGTMAPLERAAILLMPNDTIEGSAGVISNYTARSSLSFTGMVRDTTFDAQPQLNSSVVGARAEWRRQMTRDLALRAAYGRNHLRSQGPEGEVQFIHELLDIGIDYGRAVSLARRTSFMFRTETSMLRDQDNGRYFRLNGHVGIEHRFLRTWVTSLSARRGTDFLPGFRAPVLTEAGQLSLEGFLAKRLILQAGAIAGRAGVAFDDNRTLTSYTGNAKLTVAMTRHLGVFSQYAYSQYRTPATTDPLFLVPRGTRHAVSVGVEAWLSIYNKDKVIRDPR